MLGKSLGTRHNFRPHGFLPPFFVYIAWFLSLLFFLTGAAFTVFYSLQWEADVWNQWLTSILVSLVQDVLINQPLKVVALATLLSLIIKKPPEQDSVAGPSLFQSKKAKDLTSKPVQEDELVEDEENSNKRWNMREAVQEVISFLIFSIILMIVCYADQHPARYQFANSTSSLFGGFDKVSSNCLQP